jgi:hypothetical protein
MQLGFRTELQPPAPATQFGSLMGPQRTSPGMTIAMNRSAKALRYVPEANRRIPLGDSIASCAIGAGQNVDANSGLFGRPRLRISHANSSIGKIG